MNESPTSIIAGMQTRIRELEAEVEALRNPPVPPAEPDPIDDPAPEADQAPTTTIKTRAVRPARTK